MNKKVVFLDMDGTLILRDGTMPESAQEALRRARANGHEMVICTGRSTTQIEPILKENSDLFDGCVAAAGAQVNRGDEIIWHDCMSPEMAQDLVSYFHENNVTFFLQADSGVYAEPSSMDNIVAAFKALGRTEEETEIVKAFADWFGSAEVQTAWSEEFDSVPCNTDAVEMVYGDEIPEIYLIPNFALSTVEGTDMTYAAYVAAHYWADNADAPAEPDWDNLDWATLTQTAE